MWKVKSAWCQRLALHRHISLIIQLFAVFCQTILSSVLLLIKVRRAKHHFSLFVHSHIEGFANTRRRAERHHVRAASGNHRATTQTVSSERRYFILPRVHGIVHSDSATPAKWRRRRRRDSVFAVTLSTLWRTEANCWVEIARFIRFGTWSNRRGINLSLRPIATHRSRNRTYFAQPAK